MRTEQEVKDVIEALERQRVEIIQQFEGFTRSQGVLMRTGDHDGLVTACAVLRELEEKLARANRLRDTLRWVTGESDYLPIW